MSPLRLVTAPFRSMLPSSHPPGCRGVYRREVIAWSLLAVAGGAAEGGVMGILAKRLFEGHVDGTALNWCVAALTAAQGFTNLSSFAWAAMSHGRHKVRVLTLLNGAMVAMIAAIAIVPRSPLGLVMLLALLVGARCCWAGVVTLRTTAWHANYPRERRAGIAGGIATASALMVAAVGFGVGRLMDIDEASFRWIYPTVALAGIAGTGVYARIRIRGHKALLQSELETPRASSTSLLSGLRLIGEDRAYARYMGCQFVFGLGNLMVTAPLVVAVVERFSFDYLREILVVSTIPVLLVPLSIPLWARFLDRVHVVPFRAIHSWSFVLSTACLAGAVALGNIPLLWTGAVVRGAGFGGAVLAWNLGHHDFAPLDQSGRYMGLHVTLTGIRSLIGPALGMALWGLAPRLGDPTGALPFVAATVVTALGGVGFVLLARQRARQER